MLVNQFYTRLLLNIILGMMFVYALIKAAKHNAITLYPQKSNTRRVLGWCFVILATMVLLSCLFQLRMLKFPDVKLNPTITSQSIIRPSSRVLHWGYPTPVQFAILSSILSIFTLLGVAGYCFFSQKSNNSWWKKVLKLLIFLLLLIFMYSATDLHYFDIYEFIAPVLFFTVWLLIIRHSSIKKEKTSFPESSNSNMASCNDDEILDNNNSLNTVSQLVSLPVNDTNKMQPIHEEVSNENEDRKADTEIKSIALADSEEHLEPQGLHSEPNKTEQHNLAFCPSKNKLTSNPFFAHTVDINYQRQTRKSHRRIKTKLRRSIGITIIFLILLGLGIYILSFLILKKKEIKHDAEQILQSEQHLKQEENIVEISNSYNGPILHHSEFMGIPLDEPISTFTSKLKEKGFSINDQSSSLQEGIRLFDGFFFGHECTLYTYYNALSKVVYRTKVCIDFYSKSNADLFIEDIINGLDRKYGEGFYREFESDGFPGWERYMIDHSKSSISNDNDVGYLVLGTIQIFMSYNDYFERYTVFIDYYDAVNYGKNWRELLEDL